MLAEIPNLVELGIAVLTGSGLTELIRALRSRRKDRVDSTATLNDSTLKWAQDLKKDSDEARAEAQQAWQLLRTTRVEMEAEFSRLVSELHKHRQLAEVLTYRYRVLVGAIMSPNASVESLRQLVDEPSYGGHNGTGG